MYERYRDEHQQIKNCYKSYVSVTCEFILVGGTDWGGGAHSCPASKSLSEDIAEGLSTRRCLLAAGWLEDCMPPWATHRPATGDLKVCHTTVNIGISVLLLASPIKVFSEVTAGNNFSFIKKDER